MELAGKFTSSPGFLWEGSKDGRAAKATVAVPLGAFVLRVGLWVFVVWLSWLLFLFLPNFAYPESSIFQKGNASNSKNENKCIHINLL